MRWVSVRDSNSWFNISTMSQLGGGPGRSEFVPKRFVFGMLKIKFSGRSGVNSRGRRRPLKIRHMKVTKGSKVPN